MQGSLKIAFFLATSGHSGVDRAMRHLLPELASRGYAVDLIRVRNHGPWLPEIPPGMIVRETRTSHVYSSLFFLIAYLKEHEPDVLFADKDRVNRTALMAVKLAGVRTRVVVSLGTTVSINLADRGLIERQLQKHSIKHLYPWSHRFIVSSRGVAEDIERYVGRAFPNLQVVPSPVISKKIFQLDLPRPDHVWFHPRSKPVILGVGELSFRKDFSTLLKAFSLVRHHVDCRLMLLGEGKRRAQLQTLVSELSLNDCVSMPGFVNDPYPYMAHADLLALTSLWEGLGFVLIEALALGTPVVSTDCPSGPREVLDNGRYGSLVPVGDHENLAKAIIQTLQAPLSRNILQQAAWPYEIERSTQAYLEAMGFTSSAQE